MTETILLLLFLLAASMLVVISVPIIKIFAMIKKFGWNKTKELIQYDANWMFGQGSSEHEDKI